jgi:putative tricarboxylic transport membrane protein
MRSDRVIGAGLLLLAAVYFALSYGIPATAVDDPVGPTAYPRGLAGLLALGSVVLLARRPRPDAPPEGEATSVPDGMDRLAATLALTAAYVVLFQAAGYLLITPLYLGAFARLLGYRAWRPLVAAVVALTLAIWLVFAWLLGIRLPQGPFVR